MVSKYDFDYIVIGSGAAGGTAAMMAANAGKSVALVEAKMWGGASPNFRNVPFAAATQFSHLYNEAKAGVRFGISSGSLRYNYPIALKWRAVAAKRAGANSKRRFEKAGVKCIPGFAHFVSPNTVAVSNRGELKGKKFIIATGAVPVDSGISGLDAVKCLTPEEVLRLERLPKVVLVAGAGASGCEIAEYLAELGIKVILAELADRILPREDQEVAEVLEKYFTKKLGMKVLTQARVIAVENSKGVKRVIFMKDGREKSVRVEEVILATGTKPATDLGLENAGVKYGVDGIKVGKSMETSARNIFAVGDVANSSSKISSTEIAAYEAAVAMTASVNRAKGIADYRGFSRITSTHPQVASVGLNEDDCIKRDLKYKTTLVPLSLVPAANIHDFKDGFIKMITNREKKVLGATIVAPDAETVIQEVALAIRMDAKLLDIATTPHSALGWGELVRIAARRLASE